MRKKHAIFKIKNIPPNRAILVAALAIFWAVPVCYAQNSDGLARFTVLGGVGAESSLGQSRATTQLGGSFDLTLPNKYFGWLFEGGYATPTSDFTGGSGFFSANYMVSWTSKNLGKVFPFATAGYTRLFGTANAVNFGGGLDYQISHGSAVRMEIRDYYSPSVSESNQGHDVAFRIGYVLYLPDY